MPPNPYYIHRRTTRLDRPRNIGSRNKTWAMVKLAYIYKTLCFLLFISFVVWVRLILSLHDDALLGIRGTPKWKPKDQWDAPPSGLYKENDTGSMQNCTRSFTTVRDATVVKHEDGGQISISCHIIRYRAPKAKIRDAGPLLIGVLSAAGGKGPKRRNYIRSTWANDFTGTFFLVAGSWDEIEKEYMFYQDMIWIDEEEKYEGEDSVLTYKTTSYFTIAQMFTKKPEDGGLQHAIKTDDDSYVNIGEFRRRFLGKKGEDMHYYGHCPQYQLAPLRDREMKWVVSYETYPEPMFPLYCQGAGFGLSRTVLDCIVSGNHVSDFRYMPFEDVSIGILAERCGYSPIMIKNKGIKPFRADTPKERGCVQKNIPMTECYKDDPEWPPVPNMEGTLVQHRVDTKEDMDNIHKSLDLEPREVEPIPDTFDFHKF